MQGTRTKPATRARAPRLSPDARRAQLLQCAIEVFALHGIAQARPSEVARRAGVSEATVFVYFPTRDALVWAVLDEVERHYMVSNRQFLEDGSLPAATSILMLGAAFAESVDRDPFYARVWLDWSNSAGEAIFARYVAYQEAVVRLVTETLRQGSAVGDVAADVVVEDAARILYGAAQMVVQLKLTETSAPAVARFLISSTRAVLGRPIRDEEIPETIRRMCAG